MKTNDGVEVAMAKVDERKAGAPTRGPGTGGGGSGGDDPKVVRGRQAEPAMPSPTGPLTNPRGLDPAAASAAQATREVAIAARPSQDEAVPVAKGPGSGGGGGGGGPKVARRRQAVVFGSATSTVAEWAWVVRQESPAPDPSPTTMPLGEPEPARPLGVFQIHVDATDRGAMLRAEESVGQQRRTASFQPPLVGQAFDELVTTFAARVEYDAEATALASMPPELEEQHVLGSAPQALPNRVGWSLREGLLLGPIDSLFRETAARCHPTDDHYDGLRLRLVMDGEAGPLAKMTNLPWNAMYSDSERWFGRSDRFPISLALPTRTATSSLEMRTPLRLLVVAPNPVAEGLTRLQLKAEQTRIKAALERHPAVTVELLDPPTKKALGDALDLHGPFDAIHYMGHASLDDEEGLGALTFEDGSGGADDVSAEIFAELVTNHASVRLVVLNACSTAKLPADGRRSPFVGVASALAHLGLPAVVAMRYAISDRAATEFADKLYASLAAGRPVDVAAAQGRRAVWRELPSSLEWVSPTVFMQVPDGQLRITGGMPIRIGICSMEGWDPGMRSRCREAGLDLCSFFHGTRFIHEQEDWDDRIGPIVRDFLRQVVREGDRTHLLELPAHASVAYAAGMALDVQAGYRIAVRQRGEPRTTYWRSDDPVPTDAAGWLDLEPKTMGDGADLVLAISAANDVVPAVEKYLREEGSPAGIDAGAMIVAALPKGASKTSIHGGGHAWQLAEQLAAKLLEWRVDHPDGVIHLFASGPNALLFNLGRHGRRFGRVALYEFLGFDTATPRTYQRSMTFPEPWGREGSGVVG